MKEQVSHSYKITGKTTERRREDKNTLNRMVASVLRI